MANLEICLLGTYQITRDTALITTFSSNKMRGLLAYLVVGTGRLHLRRALADAFAVETFAETRRLYDAIRAGPLQDLRLKGQ